MVTIRPPKPIRSNDTLAVVLVRDAAFHIRPFIEHHLEMGFDHIILLDNGSVDETVSIAMDYPAVAIYQCMLDFGGYQIAMREWALRKFGRGHWCLSADVDEHFDWPHRGTESIADLAERLHQLGHNAMIAHMIDACGRRDVDREDCSASIQDFRKSYPFLYLSGYRRDPFHFNQFYHRNAMADESIPCLMGGLRYDLFGAWDFLTKVPFFHYSGGVLPLLLNAHTIFGSNIAGTTAVLRHYNVVGDYSKQAAVKTSLGYSPISLLNYSRALAIIEATGLPAFDELMERHAVEVDDVSELAHTGLVSIDSRYAALTRTTRMAGVLV